MKITKETKLGEIIPDNFWLGKAIDHSKSDNPRISIKLKKRPSKEDLLKKAQEDYSEGTIFQALNCDEKYTSYGNIKSIDYEIICQIENKYPHIYLNGEWAKIIRKPVLKINDTFLYEGDKFWYISTIDNWKLKQHEALELTDEMPHSPIFEFRQDALEYIMDEAKRRFQGRIIIDIEAKETIFIRVLDLGKDCISNQDDYVIWRSWTGFMAEPVKENDRSASYSQCEWITETIGILARIGCDEEIPFSQIKAVTKAVKKLTKK